MGPQALGSLTQTYLRLIAHELGGVASENVEFTTFLMFDSVLQRRLGLCVFLQSFRVEHSKDSHGVILTFPAVRAGGGGGGGEGQGGAGALVLVYSGDTRPCQQLV